MEKSWNDLTTKELEEIKRLAALAFTPREIAIMLEVEADEFICVCDLPGCDIYNAFHSGRLQTEVDLRKSVFKLANSGSSPAQMLAIDLINKSKQKMIDR